MNKILLLRVTMAISARIDLAKLAEPGLDRMDETPDGTIQDRMLPEYVESKFDPKRGADGHITIWANKQGNFLVSLFVHGCEHGLYPNFKLNLARGCRLDSVFEVLGEWEAEVGQKSFDTLQDIQGTQDVDGLVGKFAVISRGDAIIACGEFEDPSISGSA